MCIIILINKEAVNFSLKVSISRTSAMSYELLLRYAPCPLRFTSIQSSYSLFRYFRNSGAAGFFIPSFFIRDMSVVGFNPRIAAAPLGPLTLQCVALRIFSM